MPVATRDATRAGRRSRGARRGRSVVLAMAQMRDLRPSSAAEPAVLPEVVPSARDGLPRRPDITDRLLAMLVERRCRQGKCQPAGSAAGVHRERSSEALIESMERAAVAIAANPRGASRRWQQERDQTKAMIAFLTECDRLTMDGVVDEDVLFARATLAALNPSPDSALHLYERALSDEAAAFVKPHRATNLTAFDVIDASIHAESSPLADTGPSRLRPASRSARQSAAEDLAAMLFYRWNHGSDASGEKQVAKPLAALRKDFQDALKKELDARGQHATLFDADPQHPDAPRYNGLALQNAVGKHVEDLVDDPALMAIPRYAKFNKTQRLFLLRRNLQVLREDDHFKFGSVEHSLATTIIRTEALLNRQDKSNVAHMSLRQMCRTLITLQEQWLETNGESFSPVLHCVVHLAESSGFKVLEAGWRERVAKLGAMTGQIEALRQSAVANWLPQVESNGQGTTSLHRVYQGLDMLFVLGREKIIVSSKPFMPHLPVHTPAYTAWLSKVREIMGIEGFEASNVAEEINRYKQYSAQRLRARSMAVPLPFSESEAIRKILAEHKLEPDTRHFYTLSTDDMNLARSRHGTYVEEFRVRARWTGRLGRTMLGGDGRLFEPRAELQKAEEAHNQKALSDPRYGALCREWFRGAGRYGQPIDFAACKSEGVRRHTATLESELAVKAGLAVVSAEYPLVDPAHTVIQGLKKGSMDTVAVGAVQLLLDVLGFVAFDEGDAVAAHVGPETERKVVTGVLDRPKGLSADAGELAGVPELVPPEESEPVLTDADRPAAPGDVDSVEPSSPQRSQVGLARYDSPDAVPETAALDVQPEAVDDRLPERPETWCVTQAEQFLRALGPDELRDFDQEFGDHFTVSAIMETDLTAQEVDEAIDSLREFYRFFYERSVTFRRSFNYAVDKGNFAGNDGRTLITLEDDSEIIPSCNRARKRIRLPARARFVHDTARQVTSEGVEPLDMVYGAIHELTHLTANLPDMEIRSSMRAYREGSPVDRLTEIYMAETFGIANPRRIVYGAPTIESYPTPRQWRAWLAQETFELPPASALGLSPDRVWPESEFDKAVRELTLPHLTELARTARLEAEYLRAIASRGATGSR